MVSPLFFRLRVIRNLILLKSGISQRSLDEIEVLSSPIRIEFDHFAELDEPVKRRSAFDNEIVCADVVGFKSNGLPKCVPKRGFCLTGQGKDQIDTDIIESRLSRKTHGFASLDR